jgi:hypothetical protein
MFGLAVNSVAAGYWISNGSQMTFGAPSGHPILFDINGERMRIDSSGNVGIGGTPTGFGRFEVTQATNKRILTSTAAAYGGNALVGINDIGGEVAFGIAGSQLIFATGATERARIDASGELLVGTTDGNGRISLSGSGGNSSGGDLTLDSNASYSEIQSYNSKPLYINRQGNNTVLNSGGGDVLVATTARRIDERMVVVFNGGTGSGLNLDDSLASGTATAQRFYRNGAQVGTITTTASATAYNTSSDYRLKENVQPMQDALAKIAQLNPVTYTWKADGSDGQGFIAHELQAVVPDCVTGEKDAVDAEGNPQYQGVDTSFLVATLVKAVQELTAKVASLEAQLNP